jgi:hypothetical protein
LAHTRDTSRHGVMFKRASAEERDIGQAQGRAADAA